LLNSQIDCWLKRSQKEENNEIKLWQRVLQNVSDRDGNQKYGTFQSNDEESRKQTRENLDFKQVGKFQIWSESNSKNKSNEKDWEDLGGDISHEVRNENPIEKKNTKISKEDNISNITWEEDWEINGNQEKFTFSDLISRIDTSWESIIINGYDFDKEINRINGENIFKQILIKCINGDEDTSFEKKKLNWCTTVEFLNWKISFNSIQLLNNSTEHQKISPLESLCFKNCTFKHKIDEFIINVCTEIEGLCEDEDEEERKENNTPKIKRTNFSQGLSMLTLQDEKLSPEQAYKIWDELIYLDNINLYGCNQLDSKKFEDYDNVTI